MARGLLNLVDADTVPKILNCVEISVRHKAGTIVEKDTKEHE